MSHDVSFSSSDNERKGMMGDVGVGGSAGKDSEGTAVPGDFVFRVQSFRFTRFTRWLVPVLLLLVVLKDLYFVWFDREVVVLVLGVVVSVIVWVLGVVLVLLGNDVLVSLIVGGDKVHFRSEVSPLFSQRQHIVMMRTGWLKDLVLFERRRTRVPNWFVVGGGVLLGIVSELLVFFYPEVVSIQKVGDRIVLAVIIVLLVFSSVLVMVIGVYFMGIEVFWFRLKFGFPGRLVLFSWTDGVFSVDNEWRFWGWGDGAKQLFLEGEDALLGGSGGRVS